MTTATLPCDCCEGVRVSTPAPTANRPGLDRLGYRVGTHGTFLETILARRSSLDFPALAALRTRERNDPAIALLDAWAVAADVLTFYQERIANEGYLRTATERRSILELARLIGYTPRPGVAASVYLAYTLEDTAAPTDIAAGNRANSVPRPGEQMQAFETADPLAARTEWNRLQPRRTRPQTQERIEESGLYLAGTATNLRPNDALLIDFGDGAGLQPLRVGSVEPDSELDRTRVDLLNWDGTVLSTAFQRTPPEPIGLGEIVGDLEKPPSVPPRGALHLRRSTAATFAPGSDAFLGLLATARPAVAPTLYAALRNRAVAEAPAITVYALRRAASLFGHNAPREPQYEPTEIPAGEFGTRPNPRAGNLLPQPWPDWLPDGEANDEAFLDAVYDGVLVGSPVIIHVPERSEGDDRPTPLLTTVGAATNLSRSAYGITARVTHLELAEAWWDVPSDGEEEAREAFTRYIRGTTVFCQSELLPLAEEPVEDDVEGADIELAGLVDGLEPGRWLIFSGERTDVSGTSGVQASELVMLAGVRQEVTAPGTTPLPGDRTHTFLTLAQPLAYRYRRDSVTIYGNVVRATHGETRDEVLGSGDAARPFQEFRLRQPPLTFLAARSVSGVESTLVVRVNDVRWREVETLVLSGPDDRQFVTRTDDEHRTTVVFGDGSAGARPPTGRENIRATYRNGIGAPGNVEAGQISLLATRPLGVREVINPLRASGGGDAEGRDQARANAPLALIALDRLVSTQDYADFARAFAGIGKAAAVRLSDGRRRLVHVTIAGIDDAPIDAASDLYRNLRAALAAFGDPFLPLRLDVRERRLLVISAGVRVLPDYLWEAVEPQVRAALLQAFGLERAELAGDVRLAASMRAIQGVRGVDYADIDVFDALSESQILEGFEASEATELGLRDRIVAEPASVRDGALRPAQLVFLSARVADTLILQELTR